MDGEKGVAKEIGLRNEYRPLQSAAAGGGSSVRGEEPKKIAWP